MAHPVRPDTYQEISNFYTATVYEKGAEVVRMLHTLVGGDGFRRGMDLYFKRHDGQAVTCDDFVAAIADANGRDLGQFKRWYSQAGTPQVRATGVYDPVKRTYDLTLEQSAPATPGQGAKEPFHIPFALGLIGADGRDLPLQLEGERRPGPVTRVLELTQATQRFRFVGRAGASGSVAAARLLGTGGRRVRLYRPRTADTHRRADSDPFNRWEAGTATGDDAPDATDRCRSRPGATLALDDDFVAVARGILLDDTLSPAFKAQALTLPDEGFIGEQRSGGRPRGRARRATRDDGRTGASARR